MGEEEKPVKTAGPTVGRASTPLTEAQFLSWKRYKDAEASARRTQAARKREEDIRVGTVQMNGRELFLHEPWVFDNDSY
ncbi:hypothetical protein AKJ16_DCAP24965 [Drosera capensis]